MGRNDKLRIKQEYKQAKKRRFMLPPYVYLSYLVVCTLLLTGVSFAGYISTASGSDSGRTAAGIVAVTHDENTTLALDRPDGAATEATSEFNFSVSNSISEVTIQYDIVVSLDKALPDGITMELDGVPCSGSNDNTYTFSDIGTFDAGVSKSIPHKLTFQGDFDIYHTPGSAEFPIHISVYAEQID